MTEATVLQGEFRIGTAPEDVLTTVLGSCVATCLHDPVAGIGGLNHFLLPERGDGRLDSQKFGLNLMELLINALLNAGARRDRLAAKLFGGARITRGLTNIGAANGAFALRYLEAEGIACQAQSLGGSRARRLRFWPASGRARQMLLTVDELPPPSALRPAAPLPEIVFF
jgi:chemotaxis protein CheD